MQLAILLSIGWIISAYGEGNHLVLLQQMVSTKFQTDDEREVVGEGIGNSVPISEKGYQIVANLKDDGEMQKFIRRVVRQNAHYVKDVADFAGVVPFFSGSKSVQSLHALRDEIKTASWVGETEGRVVPLNEAGYQKVVSLQHTPDMIAFARRILDAYRKRCTDEGALLGLVGYYDGKNSQQDFATLKKELFAAPWVESRDHDTVLLQRAASTNFQHDGELGVIEEGIGNTVPTNEKGYQIVADLKDNHEMLNFIRRAVRQDARYVENFADLAGVVPFYSGIQGAQSFGALKDEIRRAKWVREGEGRSVPLNEVGYQKVASLQHKPNMMAFARRILDAEKKRCTDEGALMGLVSYYDGITGKQDFATLKKELLAAPWIESRD